LAAADVRVICGPTAAGKSSLALWLAERHGCTIISADSRQIYRSFDVGTAKPSAAEQRLVPHRGIDLVEPTERYSAAQWASDAERWIEESERSGRVPLVVGGTGFYLRALFHGLFREPELDAERRAALGALLAELPVAELARWAAQLDPARAHLGRSQHLRSIEIALLTGHRLSTLHRERPGATPRTARYLVVDPGNVLATRIAARIDDMLVHGWIDETRRLAALVPAGAPAWQSTGYRVLLAVVEGTLTVDEARRQILIETRQYAKRQRTWFRHQLPPDRTTWIDPLAPDARAQCERWFSGAGEGERTS
jgi:tRNA dimethylallyltransferase